MFRFVGNHARNEGRRNVVCIYVWISLMRTNECSCSTIFIEVYWRQKASRTWMLLLVTKHQLRKLNWSDSLGIKVVIWVLKMIRRQHQIRVVQNLLKGLAEQLVPSRQQLSGTWHHKTILLTAASGIYLLDAPPCSPHLAACDFWLFPQINANMHRKCYKTQEDMMRAVNEELAIGKKMIFWRLFKNGSTTVAVGEENN